MRCSLNLNFAIDSVHRLYNNNMIPNSVKFNAMKIYQVVFLLVIITTMGCNKYKDQAAQLKTINQELSASLKKCNSLLGDYRNTINEIEASLNRALPQPLKEGQAQNLKQLKTRIDATISEIDSLLELQKSIRNRNYRMNSRASDLEKQVNELNRTVATRDSIINLHVKEASGLHQNINELNSEIEKMNNTNAQLNEKADTLTNRLNYAYFTSGTEDELIEKNIIEKDGGFLGFLGRVKKLNPQMDINQLGRIDIRSKKSFQINSEADNLKLISPHPNGSYTVESTGDSQAKITITKPEDFWSISKYMVVVTDD